jgi:hypothetical protein
MRGNLRDRDLRRPELQPVHLQWMLHARWDLLERGERQRTLRLRRGALLQLRPGLRLYGQPAGSHLHRHVQPSELQRMLRRRRLQHWDRSNFLRRGRNGLYTMRVRAVVFERGVRHAEPMRADALRWLLSKRRLPRRIRQRRVRHRRWPMRELHGRSQVRRSDLHRAIGLFGSASSARSALLTQQ